jgi:hypothetical protein
MLSYLAPNGVQMEPLRGISARSVTFPSSLKAQAGKIWLAPGKVLVLTEQGVEVWTVDGLR